MGFAVRVRSRRSVHFALLLLVATLVAVPSVPWVSTAASSAVSVRSPETGASPAPGRVLVAPAFVPGASTTDLGPLPAQTPVEVAVGLGSPDPGAATGALSLIVTPGSPEYHHYLTAAQVAERYGPSRSTYDAAVAQLAREGLSVQTSPDRSFLLARGSSASVSAAFGTTFEEYRAAGRTFFSHPTAASLPAGVPWSGVLGLGNVSPVRPANVRGPTVPFANPSATCSGSGGSGFTPCQIEKGYNATGLLSAGDNGTGFTLAVVDAYDGGENETQLKADLASFDSATSTPAGTVDYLYPVPTSHNLNATSTGWGFEESLDLEWARAIAPAATIKMAFAPDPTAGLYGSVDWLIAHQAADVISLSWGENDVGVYNAFSAPCSIGCNATVDGSYALLNPVFGDAALEGITVLSATGDCGAAGGTSGVSTDYPSSDPYVIAVGGTSLSLGSGNVYSSESAWSGNSTGASSPGCYNQGGSGGGYSPFPRPYWQVATGFPANGTHRGTPDVSAVASSASGGVEVYYAGFALAASGTSVACPVWAGFVTDLDTAATAALGFLTPSLYLAANASGPKSFHDITSGSNGYAAHAGWDPVTGLGSPNVGTLSTHVTRTAFVPSTIRVNLTASPRSGATPLQVKFQVNATGGALPYSIVEVDFGDYNSSLVANGTVSHTYNRGGAFSAWAVVIDAGGNSSVSEPIEILSGSQPLSVVVNSSVLSPPAGQSVTFQANVTGGTAPFVYNWSFGDGTFLHNGTLPMVNHTYPVAGGYCVTVAVTDAARPRDGGGSNRLLELVGGATTGFCPNAASMAVSFNVTPGARDLPGDFALAPHVTGGRAPYTYQYSSDDPYVGLCNCPVFRLPGAHRLNVLVTDSASGSASASANVTLYPALSGSFMASLTSGAAPLHVQFSARVSGGHGPNSTTWTFGDGGGAGTAAANHTYTSPGFYVAVADASDGFGGNASEAFLIDVTGSATTGPTVTATVDPAVHVPLGTPVVATAVVGGTGGPYTVNWSFAPSSFSSFGTTATEVFPYVGCLVAGSCPFQANLTVRAPNGSVALEVPMRWVGSEGENATGLDFESSAGPRMGSPTFVVNAAATAVGVPGAAVGWSFGDGMTGTGSPVSHSYRTTGNFTLNVTATDVAGEALVHTYAIASEGPGPGVVAVAGGPNVSAGVAPLRLTFSATAQGGVGAPYNFSWSLGDGTTAFGPMVNHTYLRAGAYTANVTAKDRSGLHGSATFPVVVYNVTGVDLALVLAPNITTPGAPFRATVSATAHCKASSVPSCAAGNVTLWGYLQPSGVTNGPPAPGGSDTFTVSLSANGTGSVVLHAPIAIGSWAVTVATAGRNYTGLAVQYLSLNTTALPAPLDRTVMLLGLSGAVGVATGIAAFVVLRRGRRPSGPEETRSPNA